MTEAGEECDGGDLCTAQCSWTDEGRCLSLDTSGAEQTCIQCRCQSCTGLMLGCFTNPEPGFTGNCQAVVECGHQAHCSGDACYCGSNSLCFAPNGPCRVAIDRAAADEGQSVQSCSNDSACVLYQTAAIGACVAALCASECGR